MKIFRVVPTLAFALLILIAGCSKKKAPQKRSTSYEGKSGEEIAYEIADEYGIPIFEGTDVPPDFPVWPEGTTYTTAYRDTTIMMRTQALDGLYRRALEEHGEDFEGQVTLRFIIFPDGHVEYVEVKHSAWSSVKAESLTDSMAQRVAQWTFPPGLEKPIAMTQPWKFQP